MTGVRSVGDIVTTTNSNNKDDDDTSIYIPFERFIMNALSVLHILNTNEHIVYIHK